MSVYEVFIVVVGLRVGQQQVKIVVALIVRDYEISELPGTKNELDPRSTLTAAAGGINLRFEKISKS